jgi:thiol-disulfide isomerase/thioredoxin
VDIDVEKIKADPRFNKLVERSISGWEGKQIPEVRGTTFDGKELALSELRGKSVFLYVWFTNCPPCVRITPQMVALDEKYRERSFAVIGANADQVLGLPYDDAVRAEYLQKHSISYPNIHLTEEARSALGNVNIFPTLFLIDSQGTIVKYYVNYQPLETLEQEIERILSAN